MVANTNANAHSSMRAAREVVEHGQGQVGSSLSSASDEVTTVLSTSLGNMFFSC